MLFLINTVGLSEKVNKVGNRFVIQDLSDRIFSMKFKVERLFDAKTNEIVYYMDSLVSPYGVLYDDGTFKRLDGVEIEIKDEMLRGIVAYATTNNAKVKDIVDAFDEDLQPNERSAILGYIAVALAMGLIWIKRC